jgi:hypothetical protein
VKASTIIQSIWEAAGCPDHPPGLNPPDREGVCAVTGHHGPVWPIKQALSANFSDWEHLPHVDMGDPVAGPAAVWALRVWGPIRVAESRWKDHTIVATSITPNGDIIDHHRGGPAPLDPSACHIVPLSRQRHIIPSATFGAWCTEGATVRLTDRILTAFHELADLRDRGLGESEAAEHTPRPQLTRKLGMTVPELLAAWRATAPLREQPAAIAVAIRLTRKAND